MSGPSELGSSAAWPAKPDREPVLHLFACVTDNNVSPRGHGDDAVTLAVLCADVQGDLHDDSRDDAGLQPEAVLPDAGLESVGPPEPPSHTELDSRGEGPGSPADEPCERATGDSPDDPSS